MSLRVIPMFYLEILSDFGGNCKKERTRKSGHRAPLPQRSPMSQRGLPRLGEAERPKWLLFGFASVKALFTASKFWIFVSENSYSYTDSLRTLINDW